MDLPMLEEQRALLTSLRPHTASIEFVRRQGFSDAPFTQLLSPFDPVRTKGIGPRPGYRFDDSAVVLTCRSRRELFSLLTREGLFRVERSPRGDRVHDTSLGAIDVGFIDANGRLICSTVTHEGIIHVLDDAL